MTTSRQKLPATAVMLHVGHPLAARYLEQALVRGRLPIATDKGNPAIQEDPPQEPSVVLLDADSLGEPLSDSLRSLKLRFPEGKMLVVGRKLAASELCRLLFLGVHGFIAYDDIDADLCLAVRSLTEGHVWVAREVLEQFKGYVSEISRLKRGGERTLTTREQMVLGLLERRMSDKEIAVQLGITERTVRFHLQNVFAKFGVHDRYAVVELATSRSLVRPPAAAGIAGGRHVR